MRHCKDEISRRWSKSDSLHVNEVCFHEKPHLVKEANNWFELCVEAVKAGSVLTRHRQTAYKSSRKRRRRETTATYLCCGSSLRRRCLDSFEPRHTSSSRGCSGHWGTGTGQTRRLQQTTSGQASPEPGCVVLSSHGRMLPVSLRFAAVRLES